MSFQIKTCRASIKEGNSVPPICFRSLTHSQGRSHGTPYVFPSPRISSFHPDSIVWFIFLRLSFMIVMVMRYCCFALFYLEVAFLTKRKLLRTLSQPQSSSSERPHGSFQIFPCLLFDRCHNLSNQKMILKNKICLSYLLYFHFFDDRADQRLR